MNLNFKNFIRRIKFNLHNKRVFKKNNVATDNKILIEFNAFATSHIPLSYFSNILSKKKTAKIVAIYNDFLITKNLKIKILDRLKWKIGSFSKINYFGIYNSFGVNDFLLPEIDSHIEKKSNSFFKILKKNILIKTDILKIDIGSVYVGDLIYDTYLKRYKKKTIILNNHFYNFLRDFIKLFYFWDEYISRNSIKSVIGHHAVYSYSIPLRIAINKNIPTYAINCMEVFRLNKKKYLKSLDHLDYKKQFNKLPQALQKNYLSKAKKKIDDRLKGKVSSNEGMDYVTSSSLHSKKDVRRVLNQNNKTKILIATHDFFDSVHAFGDLIFPDFYEWITYMGKKSQNSTYEWYIKTHPAYSGKIGINQNISADIVDEIIKEYPTLKLIPNNVSHKKLVAEGISCVITCFGNVAIEYPNFNIPVITCALTNPYVAYNFNIHPKSKTEFNKVINNLENKRFKVDKKEIYQYYAMKVINQDRNFIIENPDKMMKFVGGYDGQFTPKLYDYWLKNFSQKKHIKLLKKIEKFIDSGKYTTTKH